MPQRADMTSIVLPLGAMIGITGCAASSDAQVTQESMDRITSECGLPSSAIVLQPDGEVRLQPPPDATYVQVDCMLRKTRGANIRNLGLVGNEAPAESNTPGGSPP